MLEPFAERFEELVAEEVVEGSSGQSLLQTSVDPDVVELGILVVGILEALVDDCYGSWGKLGRVFLVHVGMVDPLVAFDVEEVVDE